MNSVTWLHICSTVAPIKQHAFFAVGQMLLVVLLICGQICNPVRCCGKCVFSKISWPFLMVTAAMINNSKPFEVLVAVHVPRQRTETATALSAATASTIKVDIISSSTAARGCSSYNLTPGWRFIGNERITQKQNNSNN